MRREWTLSERLIAAMIRIEQLKARGHQVKECGGRSMIDIRLTGRSGRARYEGTCASCGRRLVVNHNKLPRRHSSIPTRIFRQPLALGPAATEPR